MTDQPGLFDADAATAARDDALERVAYGTPAEWAEHADAAIRRAAYANEFLTSDDVWRELDAAGVDRPPEPRALGPRMNAAVTDGVMGRTDMFRPSDRPETHRSPKRVYRSRTWPGVTGYQQSIPVLNTDGDVFDHRITSDRSPL